MLAPANLEVLHAWLLAGKPRGQMGRLWSVLYAVQVADFDVPEVLIVGRSARELNAVSIPLFALVANEMGFHVRHRNTYVYQIKNTVYRFQPIAQKVPPGRRIVVKMLDDLA